MFKSISRIYTTQTYYRRELPPQLTSFTSTLGKKLFRQALDSQTAEIFFQLSGNFTMQSEPAFCGLGSLAMVLNALEMDPQRSWKGIWRWYVDEMLECCIPIEKIKSEGMTFQQLASTARINGLDVIAKQAHQTTYLEFLNDLKRVTGSKDVHMVVSFSRQALRQSGEGHFSPVGAFAPIDNQVLVMDTARFKYPSYFVDAKELYDAMMPVDKETQLPRGYLLLSKSETNETKPMICHIKAQDLEWGTLTRLFWDDLPDELPSNATAEDIVYRIVTKIPPKHHFFISFETRGYDLAGSLESSQKLREDLGDELQRLLAQTMNHPVYSLVSKVPLSGNENEISVVVPNTLYASATLFLLSIPRDLLVKLPTDVCRTILQLREEQTFKGLDLLKEHVVKMSQQWGTMLNSYCMCGANECTKKLNKF